MTTNFRKHYKDVSDQAVLDAWSEANQSGSEESGQLEEIMRFRAAMARNRAAIAAESYTKLTFFLLLVTSCGVLISAFCR